MTMQLFIFASLLFCLSIILIILFRWRKSKMSSNSKPQPKGYFDRKLDSDELEGIKMLVKGHYPKKTIIKVVAEKWKNRPAEEGLDTLKVGLSLLKSSGDVKIFHKVSTGELACYIDTFSGHPFDFWYLVVTVYKN